MQDICSWFNYIQFSKFFLESFWVTNTGENINYSSTSPDRGSIVQSSKLRKSVLWRPINCSRNSRSLQPENGKFTWSDPALPVLLLLWHPRHLGATGLPQSKGWLTLSSMEPKEHGCKSCPALDRQSLWRPWSTHFTPVHVSGFFSWLPGLWLGTPSHSHLA
jgi:hypothetical protein